MFVFCLKCKREKEANFVIGFFYVFIFLQCLVFCYFQVLVFMFFYGVNQYDSSKIRCQGGRRGYRLLGIFCFSFFIFFSGQVYFQVFRSFYESSRIYQIFDVYTGCMVWQSFRKGRYIEREVELFVKMWNRIYERECGKQKEVGVLR